ncbi:hypothetical protein RCZAHN_54 [Rhodobacter phage RcZahn]|nr:hypothetical protein RCZAHN_54 [Rhodobacter phage RcZahn]
MQLTARTRKIPLPQTVRGYIQIITTIPRREPVAIKFKTTQKLQTPVATEVSAYAAEIDEIGNMVAEADALEATLTKAVKDKLAKIASIRKDAKAKTTALAAKITEDNAEVRDPSDTFSEKGAEFIAELGKRGTLREITDLPMIKQLMDDQDPDLFMKLAKMNIGDVDAYLTPEERELVLKTELKDRSIKIVKRAT